VDLSLRLDLYVVTDAHLSGGLGHLESARRALRGGADVIQLRDKCLSGLDLYRLGSDLAAIAHQKGALLIVNDRLDIALACGADGVHLGQDDMPVKEARRLAPQGFIIGASVGSVEGARAAERDGADYVGLGPIFPTQSKDDAGEACGLGLLREVKSKISIPVVAIGGIGAGNATDVIAAGADGIAVISAVVSQDDIVVAARELKEIIRKGRR
jgi:thiamine-phosphate pyrophosphorylase